ncbi:hypothetical protein BDZ85DRAFT_308655 [Elsinoe ampelina]|uniref:DUF6594 domain-containing protein n=1 Tax=Elsinoe ampelina TaxID=302913 RepID=A0A6A6FZA3_9PEZI|nr:hypothetical protein BDZ85DRAFT_308655 [Elsinoe ampelina]
MTQNKYDRAAGKMRLPHQAESVDHLVRGPHVASPGTETIPAHPQLRSSSSSMSSATGAYTAIPTPTASPTSSAYRAIYRHGTNIGGEDHSLPMHAYGSELYGQYHPLKPFQQANYAPTSNSNADSRSKYARIQQIPNPAPAQYYSQKGTIANGEGEATSGQNSEQMPHQSQTGVAPPNNVFRRFMSLHHRLIAQIQSDLVIYESQLAGLEQRIRTYPGPDVGHLHDLQERRRAILAHVFQKLEQYKKAIDLASSNATLESPSPSTELFDNTEYFVIPIKQDPTQDRSVPPTDESFDSSSQSSQSDEAKPWQECPVDAEIRGSTTKPDPSPTLNDSEISSSASSFDWIDFAVACSILIILCQFLSFAATKLRNTGPVLELIIGKILPMIFSAISLISLLTWIHQDIRTASHLSTSKSRKGVPIWVVWLVIGAILSWHSYELYGILGAFLQLFVIVSTMFACLLYWDRPSGAEMTDITDGPRPLKTVDDDAARECTKETTSSNTPAETSTNVDDEVCLSKPASRLRSDGQPPGAELFSAFTPAGQLYQHMTGIVLGVTWAIGISRFLVIKTFLCALSDDGLRNLAYEPTMISLWISALTLPYFCWLTGLVSLVLSAGLFEARSDWHVGRFGEIIAAYRAQLTIEGETGSLRKAHLKDLEKLCTRWRKTTPRREHPVKPFDTGKAASEVEHESDSSSCKVNRARTD